MYDIKDHYPLFDDIFSFYADVTIAAKQSSESSANNAATAGSSTVNGGGPTVMPVAITRMDDWSIEKVADWLKENNLQHLTDKYACIR